MSWRAGSDRENRRSGRPRCVFRQAVHRDGIGLIIVFSQFAWAVATPGPRS